MSSCNHRYLRGGETLFRQGTEGHSAFLVKEGRIDIVIDRDGARVKIAELGPGEIVGEMAIIDGRPRSADAVAQSDSVLFEFTKDQFERRLAATDPLVQMVLDVILKRFRGMLGTDKPGEAPSNLRKSSLASASNALIQLELERDLAEALRTNALTLFYQPIIDLQSGVFAGMEALVRWHHPSRGLLGPAQFIPVAEATGLITQLTRWAIRDVCANLPEFQLSALKAHPSTQPLFVSVNVSAADLISDRFAEDVEGIVTASGIDPACLKLEITESTLINNLERSIDVLNRLRAIGLRVSIDDFGTGYSSLASLSRLPLDTLKVDRAFVTPLDIDPASHKIVQAVVQLADMMTLETIAEGIETAEQRDIIRRLGGRYGQGYLFGRPMPIETIHQIIRSWSAAWHGGSTACLESSALAGHATTTQETGT